MSVRPSRIVFFDHVGFVEDLFNPNDLSRGEIRTNKDRPFERERTVIGKSAAYCNLCLLFITAASLLYQYGQIIALSLFTHHGTLSQPWTRTRCEARPCAIERDTSVAYVFTTVRGGVSMRNSAKPLLFVNNFQIVDFLANVNSSSCSLFVIDGPSVCRLSVCNVGAPYSGD